jgi:hypothetical protein
MMWTVWDTHGHTAAHHTQSLVPWKISPTSRSPNRHHTYGSIHSPKKASPWWTPRATAGSSAAQSYGGSAMNALLTTYLLLIVLAMIVIAILENNDGGPA